MANVIGPPFIGPYWPVSYTTHDGITLADIISNKGAAIKADAYGNLYFHNIYGNFVSQLADYLRTDLFDRAKDTVISTNHKAIEHFRNRKRLGGENWAPQFPFLVVDPKLDFEPADTARPLHHYPNFNGNFASKIYNPAIYQDNNIRIGVIPIRYRGTIDITVYASSIYELIDFQSMIHRQFGGLNRPIYPKYFECYLIIPEGIENYVYNNPYTSEHYTLDWTTTDCQQLLIKNINQNRYTYPILLKPYLTLTSVSSDFDKMGGAGDIISNHVFNFTISYECDLPSHFILNSYMTPEPDIKLEFQAGSYYTPVSNPINPSEKISIYKNLTSTAAIVDSSSSELTVETIDIYYKKAVNYIITELDSEAFRNEENVTIDIGENVIDSRYIRIYGRYGFLVPDLHYKVIPNTSQILLYGFNLKILVTSSVLTFFIYEELQTVF